MAPLFVTGAGGFVGSRLLASLETAEIPYVGLTRAEPGDGPARRVGTMVTGDLLQPDTYREALNGADAVIHLAATTGNAGRAEYELNNVEATRLLVSEAGRAGITRFLCLSTIAVKFPKQYRYYYAQSKARAEAAVRSATSFGATIIRPTMVIGRDSPVLAGMVKLAALPVIPVLGNGRVRVQPIFVEDLVQVLIALLGQEQDAHRTIEIGGPDVVTMEALLARIHERIRGRAGRMVHIPLGPVIPPLTLLELIARRWLPLTVGQLASFRNDGTADEIAPVPDSVRPRTSLDEMLDVSLPR